MSRRDLIHRHVRKALERDGWTITHDPLKIEVDEQSPPMEIDLAAEKLITAEKADEKIAVEVKSFLSTSILSSFHTAIGQFIDYRDALELAGEERILYLAVSEDAYSGMQEIPFVMHQIRKHGLNVIVVDIQTQVISQWL